MYFSFTPLKIYNEISVSVLLYLDILNKVYKNVSF